MAEEAPEELLLVALRLALRDVGGVPSSVREIGDMKAEVLVSVVARSVKLIDAAEGTVREANEVLPDVLGPGVASRHRACASMAARVRELGYDGEIGYNQLLYPSENSSRALLAWLVDRLPRSRSEELRAASETAADMTTTGRAAAERHVGKWAAAAWRLPPRRDARYIRSKKGDVVSSRWQTWPLLSEEEDSADAGRRLPTAQIPADAEVAPTLLELAAALAAAAERRAALVLDDDDGGGESGERNARAVSLNVRGRDVLGAGATEALDFNWAGRDAMPSLRDMLNEMERVKNGKGLGADDDGSASSLGRLAHAAKFEHDDSEKQPPKKKKTTPEEEVDNNKKDASAEQQQKEEEEAPKEEEEEPEKPPEPSETERLTSEVEALGEAFARERQLVSTLEAEREALLRAAPQIAAEIAATQEAAKALERDYAVRRKTLELLPEASSAIAKLREICAASAARLAELETEWETHRGPLAEAIERKKAARAKRKARARAMVDEMKRCRADMQRMVSELAEKDARAEALEREYAKMPKNVNRALYTYRIMDIIGSVAKQKKEIAKIIDDIRALQKANNKIAETLRRAEAVADERVYAEANLHSQAGGGAPAGASSGGGGLKGPAPDPAAVASYRALSDLRHNFEAIVAVISDTGARDREARDYETRRKQLKSRLDANNLTRILDDLKQVKAENDKLLAQLKKKTTTTPTPR